MYYQRHGWNIWYNEHYMSKSVSHAISTLDLYHPSGWYRVLGLIWHMIQILTCNIQYIACKYILNITCQGLGYFVLTKTTTTTDVVILFYVSNESL
jgi:hypothetical protein